MFIARKQTSKGRGGNRAWGLGSRIEGAQGMGIELKEKAIRCFLSASCLVVRQSQTSTKAGVGVNGNTFCRREKLEMEGHFVHAFLGVSSLAFGLLFGILGLTRCKVMVVVPSQKAVKQNNDTLFRRK